MSIGIARVCLFIVVILAVVFGVVCVVSAPVAIVFSMLILCYVEYCPCCCDPYM